MTKNVVKRKTLINFFIFMFPALLIYTTLRILPILFNFYYSLTDWRGFAEANFIGLANFRELISDTQFHSAIWNTLVVAFFVVILQNAIALGLAILVNKKLKGTVFFRTAFFIPVLLSTMVVGITWRTLMGLDGIVTSFLGVFGLENFVLWAEESTALTSVIFIIIWQFLGYSMVIFIAGLQNIPEELYEAARIDGAGARQRFLHITFPLIAPALTINMVLATIGSFRQFDHVFVLTGGGPWNSSHTVGTWIFTIFSGGNRHGYAVAMSVVLFFMTAVVSMIQMWLLRRREVN